MTSPDGKEARRRYVEMYARSRLEEMSPNVSDVDWDTWKRQAREAWDAAPGPKSYQRVSAHRLDRMGTVVVGVLLPYDANQGERVKDDNGVVWNVVAASVLVAEEGR
jgi:hypothetical protein